MVITTKVRKIWILFLSKTVLFKGCTDEEIKHMLICLKNKIKKFDKVSIIYNVGEIVTDVCLILSGSVQIENVDVVGNKSILGVVRQGDIFAESYACIPNQPILVDVKTCEATEILFINVPALFVESNSCGHRAKLIQNLLRVSSRKNINLSMRIFHSASKTIRGRLISYFSEQVSVQGTNNIKIPLDLPAISRLSGSRKNSSFKGTGEDEG